MCIACVSRANSSFLPIYSVLNMRMRAVMYKLQRPRPTTSRGHVQPRIFSLSDFLVSPHRLRVNLLRFICLFFVLDILRSYLSNSYLYNARRFLDWLVYGLCSTGAHSWSHFTQFTMANSWFVDETSNCRGRCKKSYIYTITAWIGLYYLIIRLRLSNIRIPKIGSN